MSKLARLIDLSDEMAACVSNVSVERGEMYEYCLELERTLPLVNEHLARMWRTLGDRMADTMPVDGAVTEFIGEIGVAQSTIGEATGEFPRLVRTVHAVDMGRHEAPRHGEDAWNVA